MTPVWPRHDKQPPAPPLEPVPGTGQPPKKSLPPSPPKKDK